jgi:hypothetical protein
MRGISTLAGGAKRASNASGTVTSGASAPSRSMPVKSERTQGRQRRAALAALGVDVRARAKLGTLADYEIECAG